MNIRDMEFHGVSREKRSRAIFINNFCTQTHRERSSNEKCMSSVHQLILNIFSAIVCASSDLCIHFNVKRLLLDVNVLLYDAILFNRNLQREARVIRQNEMNH